MVRRARTSSTSGASAWPTSTAPAPPTSSTSRRDGVRLYFNQSGNALERRRSRSTAFPRVDDRRPSVHGGRPARQRHRLPGLVVAAARRRAAADALRRPDGRPEAAPAGRDRSTTSAPRRASHYAPSTKFYLADKRAGTPVDHAAAVPGARGRAGRDLRPHQPQPLRHPLRLPPRLLRRRRARVPRLRHGRAVGHRGVRGARRAATLPDAATTSTPRRTCRRCYTKTWFHTGVYLGREHVSDYFARRVLPRARPMTGSTASRLRPDCCCRDTVLPDGPDRRRGARGLPRAQGLDAAPGGLRASTATDRVTTAPLHRHRAELHDPRCCSRAAATATPSSSPTRARRSTTTTSATRPIRASATRSTLRSTPSATS